MSAMEKLQFTIQLNNKWCLYMGTLYFVTFLFILPPCLINVKNSLYHLKDNVIAAQKSELNINSKRTLVAELYLNSTKKLDLDQNITTNIISPTVLFTIITTNRIRKKYEESYNTGYLTQTASKLIHLLTNYKSFEHSASLIICNVDKNTEAFSELKYIQNFIPVINKYTGKHNLDINILEKEKQDYIFCLSKSLHFNPKFVFLIEDDALPEDNMLAVLHYTVFRHFTHNLYDQDSLDLWSDTLFVKFYHPERLLGYLSLDPERLSELFATAGILTTVVCVLFYQQNLYPASNKYSAMFFWLLLLVYFAGVLLAIGRANVNLWRNLFTPYFHSFSPAPSCCTPAMLYPAQSAHSLVQYLSNVTCYKGYGKDSAIDDLLKLKRFRGYIVQPNTFKHIGMYSSLRKNLLDPDIV